MSERSQKQIDKEIKALEACKEYVPPFTMFGEDNHHNLDLQIEYLRGEIDITAEDEWNEYSDDEQSTILEAQAWKDGESNESPSSGWDDRKPKKKKK